MSRRSESSRSKYGSAYVFNRPRPTRQRDASSEIGLFSANPRARTRSATITPAPTMLDIGDGGLPADRGAQVDDAGVSCVEEVIMAIDMRDNSTIGCAYFNTADGVLSLSDDITMANLDIAGQFLTHVEPTTVLVSGRAPEELLELIQAKSQLPETASTDDGNFILRALPSSEFSVALGLEKILSLQLDACNDPLAVISTANQEQHDVAAAGLGPQQGASSESHHLKMIRRGTDVDLDSNVSVICAGAVLADLHRRRSVGFLPDGQKSEFVFHVRCLQTFSLSNSLLVSSEALRTLQIIRSELHPNSQVWGPEPSGKGALESLSVYGLFHLLAHTSQGRFVLRKMFLRPTMNLDLIRERQQSIALFIRPENADMMKQAGVVLKRIKNAKGAIEQLRKGIDSASADHSIDRGVWAVLRGFSAQALRLREMVAGIPGGERVQVVRDFMEHIQPRHLLVVGDLINRTIDFEQSKSRHRPSVKEGVDVALDELKRRYDGMGSFLTEVVRHISEKVPEWARQYIRSCIFLPQLGFLTVVEPDSQTGAGRYEGEGSDSGTWDQLFSADGAVCYKNDFMKELDDQYGDMYCEIGDREVEIIHDLAREIIRYEGSIIAASEICGRLDALMALAKGAEKYKWICPDVTETGALYIRGGRHPLQELVVPSFVPNDCYLAQVRGDAHIPEEQGPRSMILTGPNHSGKSIFLKQTAIIVYLAHVGSFVPAAHAVIGLTDKILVRMSTRESVARNESAFAIDLKCMAQLIRRATSKSLVLVDEFGKGTNADDGAGLLAASLDHFVGLRHQGPRFLMATHFHKLFESGIFRDGDSFKMAHMDVRTGWGAGDPDDQITYLFKLCEGYSNSSFGGRCAALNGVPSAVVNRAEAIAQLLSRNEDLTSSCARLSLNEERRLQKAEAVARQFLQLSLNSRPPTMEIGLVEGFKDVLNQLLTAS